MLARLTKKNANEANEHEKYEHTTHNLKPT